MRWMIVATIVSLGFQAEPAFAEIKFAAWNVGGVRLSADTLKTNAAGMQTDIGAIDILVVEEVTSFEQVSAIAEGLGLEHWAISDFSPPVRVTGNGFFSLEVAVISRFPIEGISEWDTTGQLPLGDGHVPRSSNENLVGVELDIDVQFGPSKPSRGFLRVDIEGGWTVYAVHWKSSRGQSCNAEDIGFARKREDQAAGVVSDARSAIANKRTVVVAGDYNIQAPENVPRSGIDPAEDCNPTNTCVGICGAGGKDGYDDSIQTLFSLGHDTRLLTQDTDFTFVGGRFPGGAIDHILVAGPRAKTFSSASTPNVSGNRYRSSDHRPVFSISTAQ